MSGGSYNYAYSKIDDFRYDLSKSANTPERKAFVKLLEKVSEAARAIEWNDSGDGADESTAIMKCLAPSAVIEAAIESARAAVKELQETLTKYEP